MSASTARRMWLAAAMLFVIIRALPVITYPLSRDQGSHLLIGEGLLEGKQLYRDLWENRPPAIFYVSALMAKVFGRVMWSAAVVDILWLLVISYCIFRFAERYVGSAGAAISAMFHASWHVEANYVWTAQPETFQVLLVFIAYFLLAGRGGRRNLRIFSAGLLLGAACWFKYNAIAFVPFLLLVPYLDTSGLDDEPRRLKLVLTPGRWFRTAAVLLAGLVTALGVVVVYFWAVGTWPAMKEVQFEVLPRYAMMSVRKSFYFDGVTPIEAYWMWVALATKLWLGAQTEFVTLAALVIAWWRRELGRMSPVFLSAGIAYASTAMQVRFHDYYFQTCYPFFAIMWGYVGVKIYEGCRAAARMLVARRLYSTAALVWIIFALLVYKVGRGEQRRLRDPYGWLKAWRQNREFFYAHFPGERRIEHLRDQLGVVRYLRGHSARTDGVFLWGANPLIYFLSDRYPPSRFVSNLGLVSVWSPPAWRAELVRDLKRSPPRFILVASQDSVQTITYTYWDSKEYLNFFPELNSFIRNNYRPVADFRTFLVYRRIVQ